MTIENKIQTVLKVLTVLDKVIDFIVGLISEKTVNA